MGRPRVIVASLDEKVAAALVASLNPARYRVEQAHDLNEALLRAKLLLAHAVVLHVAGKARGLGQYVRDARAHDIAIIVAAAPGDTSTLERELGPIALAWPTGIHEIKRAVALGVEAATAAREANRGDDDEDMDAGGWDAGVANAAVNPRQRVLVLVRDREVANVIAAVFESQAGVGCDVVVTGAEALVRAGDGYACLLADPELLMSSAQGPMVAATLGKCGVPMIPLAVPRGMDLGGAGQVAWAAVPQLRQSLRAHRG
ncbi:MAG: hypothetical protein EXR75_15535 [Myxococcales bacterium]|nr:hypothetical protein [Myxococcales bacterium]